MPELPDAPWATAGKELPDAPWAVAKPASKPKSDSYFGIIPMAKAAYHSLVDAATLPGDVYAGRAQVPSKAGEVPGSAPLDSPAGQAGAGRIANMAMAASPSSVAGRAGAPVMEAAAAPALAELKQAEKLGFSNAKNMGVEIAPTAMRDLGAQIEQKLQNKGILPEHAPTAYQTLGRLRAPPEGSFSTISDLHNLRQAFGNSAGNILHPKDTLAGSMGKEALDSYLSAIPTKDILAGDAAAASATLKDAIGNSAAAFRAEDVGARLTRAERQAAKSGSGSNIDNAIRQKISAILDVPARSRGYAPQELAQMEQIVRGTPAANIARKVGKLGVGDGLSLLIHTIMAGASGGASIPIAAAGTASRKIAEALTQRGANRLDEMIRARSPLAQSAPSVATPGPAGVRNDIVRLLAGSQGGQFAPQ